MVTVVADFYTWGLEVKLTEPLYAQFRRYLRGVWRNQDLDEISGVLKLIEQHGQLVEMDEVDRELRRQALQEELVQNLLQSREDPLSGMLLEAYGATIRVIARGSVPLTRKGSDAYLQFIVFISSQAAGQAPSAIPGEALDDFAGRLAQAYENLDTETQRMIAQMPLFLASIRSAWQRATEVERSRYRAEWSQLLAGEGRKPEPLAREAGDANHELGSRILRDHSDYMRISNALMRNWLP